MTRADLRRMGAEWRERLTPLSRLDAEAVHRRRSADSGRWHTAVNVVSASPWLPWRLRWRLLRRCGLDCAAAYVLPGQFFFSCNVTIGPRSWINRGCHFDSHRRITIGTDVDVGMEVMFCTSSHEPGPPGKRAGAYVDAPITIEDGAWLGTRCVILPGVTVGTGSVVAAGAVVTRDCAPHGLYAGVPARRIRELPV